MNDAESILKAINGLRDDMNSKFGEILSTLDKHTELLEAHSEHLQEIEDSIGAIVEWADNVAIITKVPFASGQTKIL